ncbi:N-acetylated-alpha-linked acidic dipeptidase 2-like [Dermacentor andersoni]|uniref:N-acetylated-alpha-linked acidic dipeptidase 2-like n=1 Tax=Dermacentor andersoni TaxID=34620 RepID=UPI00241758EE|nr:N-acetylated-alpha-linked acidic dipeptidase 2-like [Dermacentor andersoni]
MLPWGRRRLVRVHSQIMGSQSAERLSPTAGGGGYSEDERSAYGSRSAAGPPVPKQSSYDSAVAGDGPVMLLNVEVLDEDNRPPPQPLQPRYSEPISTDRLERERERMERMERLERLEREEEERPRWQRSIERPAASPAMSPIAGAASPPGVQYMRPPGMASPRPPMGALSPVGSRPRLAISPMMSPRSPSRQYLFPGPPPMMSRPVSGRMSPMTPRSGARSPSWPFMSDRQVMAARQYRRERHNLLEWIMTWVFVVTLAVVLLAVLVFYASWQTRLDKKMQEHLNLLQRLSSTPRFGSAVFKDLYNVDLPIEVSLRTILKTITNLKYIAGSETESPVANYVDRFMKDNKINNTKKFTYVVSLSHPSPSDKNKVQFVDQDGNIVIDFSDSEPSNLGKNSGPQVAYNAYGRSGTYTDAVMYGNRCFPEDLDYLTRTTGRSVWASALLCRYSTTESPGVAVAAAERQGARAVLLFSDPHDISGGGGNSVFPQSWWMPGTAIRRANVRMPHDIGDPASPGFASRYTFHDLRRVPIDKTMVPKIPVQPINSIDAAELFKRLQGKECPEKWVPAFGVACHLGDISSGRLSVHINNVIHESNIQNVVAYFPGEVEPDRYVVFGVPLDSWGGGAVAPGSALAQALGLCFIINKQYIDKKHPWRPRRTIVFGAWDAHEFGEVGATEFIEGQLHKMSTRTVVYLNSDICTSGPDFSVTGSPVFSKSFREAGKWVPHYRNTSYYNAWLNDLHAAAGESGQPDLPMLRKTGGFTPFMQLAGIPSLDVAFGNNASKGVYFPALGTSYDVFELADKFIDSGYKVHRMCRELLIALLWQWSEAVLLPYDLKELAGRLNMEFNELSVQHKELLDRLNIHFDTLSFAIKRFTMYLNNFEVELHRVDLKNPLEVRRYNDRMMGLQRSFVQEVENSTASGKLRNVIFGQSDTNHERIVAFPVVRDKLDRLRTLVQQDEANAAEELKRHISLAAYALMQATLFVEAEGMV